MDDTNTTLRAVEGFIPESLRSFLTYVFPYILLTIMLLGVMGNIMSIVIFVRKRKADRVSSQYLGVLAVNDTILITVIGIPMWLLVNLENVSGGRYALRLQMPTAVGCQIAAWIHNACIVISGWIIIIFSFERMLVIWMPLRMATVSLTTPRKLSLVLLVLIANCLAFSHFRFTTLNMLKNGPGEPETGKCTFNPNLGKEENVVYTFLVLFLGDGIPIVLIVASNVAILVGLKKNSMTEGKSDKQTKTDRKAVINLMLVSLVYVITITPFVVLWLLYLYLNSSDFEGYTEAERADFNFMWLSADAFQYTNYSVNPWIYTFALDFYRVEISNILKCGASSSDKK